MTSGTIWHKKINIMPWHNGDYPPSYKNQPAELREKAVEIANALLQDGAEEAIAIATGLRQARELLENHKEKPEKTGDRGNCPIFNTGTL
jgi:uncharacterized protein YdaT